MQLATIETVTSQNIESLLLRWLEETDCPNPNHIIEVIRETSDIMCPFSTDFMQQTPEAFFDMVQRHLEWLLERGTLSVDDLI
jgi:hypothetical protein